MIPDGQSLNNMRLAIDIGNTNWTIGIADRSGWRHLWRLPTLLDDSQAVLFYEVQFRNWMLENGLAAADIQQVVASTVVPDLRATLQQLSLRLLNQKTLLLGPRWYTQLPVQANNPAELGTDLYANALAAHLRHPEGSIIVDFGTALTFTVLDGPVISGVAIAPGLKTAIRALSSQTAQLPEVPLEVPPSALGQNTVHAIQSGVLMGYVGLIRHLLMQIREDVGRPLPAIATGGLSAVLEPLKGDFEAVLPQLTLDGLLHFGRCIKPQL